MVMNIPPIIALSEMVSLRNIKAIIMGTTILNLYIGTTLNTSPICKAL